MPWPRDDAKLERVRALMADRGLDALVVRAPDNVLYLTNFWGMKGYDVCVFPREGEPTLVCLAASEEDARRTAWTEDVRLFAGYDAADPRPPLLRALDARWPVALAGALSPPLHQRACRRGRRSPGSHPGSRRHHRLRRTGQSLRSHLQRPHDRTCHRPAGAADRTAPDRPR